MTGWKSMKIAEGITLSPYQIYVALREVTNFKKFPQSTRCRGVLLTSNSSRLQPRIQLWWNRSSFTTRLYLSFLSKSHDSRTTFFCSQTRRNVRNVSNILRRCQSSSASGSSWNCIPDVWDRDVKNKVASSRFEWIKSHESNIASFACSIGSRPSFFSFFFFLYIFYYQSMGLWFARRVAFVR